MKASEFVTEKKKKKQKIKAAAWGPSPSGGYGYATGYSGVGGPVGEARTDEKWQDWVMGAGIGAAALGIGSAAYDTYKANQPKKEPTPIIQQQQDKIKKAPTATAAPVAKGIPKRTVTNSPLEPKLVKAAARAGIVGIELAQFLAQTAHESHDFKGMVEYGNSRYFKQYEPVYKKDKKTKKFILDPKTNKPKNFNPTAERLGNIYPGDGELFKGRGFFNLTGRYNYALVGNAIGVPLEQYPELAEEPDVAIKIAIWFWQNRVAPKVANFHDTAAATKPINPGLKHLERRIQKFEEFKKAMV